MLGAFCGLPKRNEQGEMMFAFIFSVGIFLLALFGIFQVAFSMAATNIVGTEITRAALQADTGSLVLAQDKDDCMKTEIAGSSTFLNSEALRVENTAVTFDRDLSNPAPLSQSRLSEITQETERATITCNVYYEIPAIITIPGLNDQTLFRRIDYTQIVRTTIEVK